MKYDTVKPDSGTIARVSPVSTSNVCRRSVKFCSNSTHAYIFGAGGRTLSAELEMAVRTVAKLWGWTAQEST